MAKSGQAVTGSSILMSIAQPMSQEKHTAILSGLIGGQVVEHKSAIDIVPDSTPRVGH